MKYDHQLKQDITSELVPWIDAANIGVSAHHGAVTLTGQVATYREKREAERAAKRVLGVREIANEIEVEASRIADGELATACTTALRAHTGVPREIAAVVERGGVRLEGMVAWHFQKVAAESAIENLAGIRGITNAIAIRPASAAIDVKHKIEAALRRNAEIEADAVSVDAHGGSVSLHGHVRSWAERDHASEVAWAVPGVTAVENDLVIEPVDEAIERFASL